MNVAKDIRTLSYQQNVSVLSRYGISVAKGDVATSPEEAIKIADEVGYPIVLKTISPQISHKTEANTLKLDIKTESELIHYYNEVIGNARRYNPKAQIQGVLVQEMIRGGVETIIGVSKDPLFGPMILFGLGGIFVEVLKDVSLRVPPLTKYDAEEMVKEIKGYRLLEGFRGRPMCDVESIIDTLLKVSRLSVDLKEFIVEVDLNPIIVLEVDKGAKVVDIRSVVSKGGNQLFDSFSRSS